MIQTVDTTKCCGCKSCSLVCPQRCIGFTEDAIGAVYPVVDRDRCIGCGKCETVCPLQGPFRGSIGKAAYAAYSNDSGIRFRGSSGGLFETMALWIIENGGSVFASKLDEDLKLKGYEATTAEGVRELTKSKYLQSDTAQLFPVIQGRLREGKQTLFCGTPCQVAALRNYLGEDCRRENLFLVDFFCHGVPSQRFFDKCKEYVEKRDKIKIIRYEFRAKKEKGATPHYCTIEYEEKGVRKRKTQLYIKDPFYLGFQKYLTLRDSCYHCPYGKGDHPGDITVGDFHDIDKYVKGIDRFQGVSTAVINTEKGQAMWDTIQRRLVVYPMSIQDLYRDKQIYTGGSQEPDGRAAFVRDMSAMPMETVVHKWLNTGAEWKKAIYYALPAPIRKAIKRAAGI